MARYVVVVDVGDAEGFNPVDNEKHAEELEAAIMDLEMVQDATFYGRPSELGSSVNLGPDAS